MIVQLNFPILIALSSRVFYPNCTTYKNPILDQPYVLGNGCNDTLGTLLYYYSEGKYFGYSLMGTTTKVSVGDIQTIMETSNLLKIVKLDSFQHNPSLILVKSFNELDQVHKVREKFLFANVEQVRDCHGNGFYTFNMKDTVSLSSHPYTFKFGFKFLGEREKRGLQCTGAGIGVGYGAGISVTASVVHTWCDTSSLELAIKKQYDDKFVTLSGTMAKRGEKLEQGLYNVSISLKEARKYNAGIMQAMATHDAQMEVLKTDFTSLNEWFQRENLEISEKLNYGMSELQYSILILQYEKLEDKIFNVISESLGLWSLNSKQDQCKMVSDVNPQNFVPFANALTFKYLTIENIDLKGKINHLFDYIDSQNTIQEALMHSQENSLVISEGLLQTEYHGVLGNAKSLKSLVSLSQESLNHLKIVSESSWKYTLKYSLDILIGSLLTIGSLFRYVMLKGENVTHSLAIRHADFMGIILTMIIGCLSVAHGVIGFI